MDYRGFMSLEEARRTQRPYRYGMILLCLGALVNWLGLAENYSEPVRYAGVACILSGGLLICTAMCCWLHTPNRTIPDQANNDDQNSVHVITINERVRSEKPPDYDVVTMLPSYDDAIKLNPAALLPYATKTTELAPVHNCPPYSINNNNNNNNNSNTRPSSSSSTTTNQPITTVDTINEKKPVETSSQEAPR